MNQSHAASLFRRLGPVFAEMAAQAHKPRMAEHKAEYRARPIEERMRGVGASPAKAYKPTHGGYPG